LYIIQTLYINSDNDPFRHSFGWAAPEYHLMGWALSCLQLHKLYGKITLYTNTQAENLLIDVLQLPYTDVHLTHDKLNLIHPDLWALPKIYTYSLQQQPFLHIDGDVFVFESFDSDLLKGELIAQNIEEETDNYYAPVQKEMIRYFNYFPPCVQRDFMSGIPVQACNAGILGGNNIEFFHDYAALAFEYVHKNAEVLKYVNVNRCNVFFEQHLFYALAKEKEIPVNVLIEGIIEDNGYRNMGDFYDVPFNRSYLHLLGEFKKDEYTCIQMASKLRELYPDYYEQIIALFHDKNIRLSPSGFINKMNPSKNRRNEQNNTHLQRLKFVAAHCPPEIEKELFQNDFETFYSQLIQLLSTEYSTNDNPDFVSIREIRGKDDFKKRDFSAQHWYRDLFAEPSDIFNHVIVRCPKTEIIESLFDWAGLFNRQYRIGIEYYADLQLSEGKFFNLIVP